MNLLEVKNICKTYGSGENRCQGIKGMLAFLFQRENMWQSSENLVLVKAHC